MSNPPINPSNPPEPSPVEPLLVPTAKATPSTTPLPVPGGVNSPAATPLPVPGSDSTPMTMPLPAVDVVEPYPSLLAKLHFVILIVPFLIIPIGSAISPRTYGGTSFSQILIGVTDVVFGLILLGFYVKELLYIRNALKNHRLVIQHVILLVGAFALTAIAYSMGDMSGIAHFQDGKSPEVVTPLLLGLSLLCTGIVTLSVGSLITVVTRGRKRALNILGHVVYAILALLTAAIAYLAYSIAYSAHDPNRE